MNPDDFNKVFGGDLIKRQRPAKMGFTFTIEKDHGHNKEASKKASKKASSKETSAKA